MFNVLLFRFFLNFPLFPDNFLKFCFTVLLQFPPFYFSFHIFPNSIYIYIYSLQVFSLACFLYISSPLFSTLSFNFLPRVLFPQSQNFILPPSSFSSAIFPILPLSITLLSSPLFSLLRRSSLPGHASRNSINPHP